MNINELRLCGQQISSMCELPYQYQLQDLPRLQVIHLFGNNITKIECINDLHSLIELNLASNLIRSLSSAPITPSLHILDLSCNKLTSLTGIESFPNLRSLLFSHNRVASLTPLTCLHLLEHVDGRNNSLSKVSDLSPLSYLNSLSSLKLFHSQGNPVTSTPNYKQTVLQLCPSLKELDGVGLEEEKERESVIHLRRLLAKCQKEVSKLTEEKGKLRKRCNALVAENEGLEVVIEDQKRDFNQKIEDLNVNLGNCNRERVILEDQVFRIEKEKDSVDSENLNQIKILKDQVESLSKRCHELEQSNKDQIEENGKILSECDTLRNEKWKTQCELNSFIKELEFCKKDRGTHLQELENLKVSLNQLTSEKSSLETRLSQLTEDHHQVSNELMQKESKIKELNSSINKQEQLIQDLREDTSRLTSMNSSYKETIGNQKTRIVELQQDHKLSIQSLKKEAQKDRETFLDHVSSLEDELYNSNQELDKLRSILSKIKSTVASKTKEKENQVKEKERLLSLNEQLGQTLSVLEKDLEAERRQTETLSSSLEKSRERILELEEIVRQKDYEIEVTVRAYENLVQEKENLEKDQTEHTNQIFHLESCLQDQNKVCSEQSLKIKELSFSLDSQKTELNKLKSDNNSFQIVAKRLQENLHKCKSDLAAVEKRLQDSESELDHKNNELEATVKAYEKFVIDKSRLEEINDKLSHENLELVRNIRSLEHDLDKAKENLSEKCSKVKEFELQVKYLNENLQELGKNYDSVQREKNSAVSRVTKLQQVVQQLQSLNSMLTSE
ncbi:hypothetical protein P9112_012000 [Eukaryota sp. TZLM1-RC]